ncbi:MAG TPA: protein kinase [Thermoanaerobaculia bacterium]|nr:protein kinase [Thermoanaerobaculia bacterium]
MGPIERQRLSAVDSGELARSEPFPPGTTIARYRLVSLIGSGAMGDVYRAHDRALDREVALKVLPPELVGDRERVHRFAQEARAASALSHPHIVTIHEVGHARPVMNLRAIGERPARAGEVHYISMELVDGQTLREALTGSLPLRQKIELLAQVADGLANAHAAGIIHRDLKPDNILVAREGYAKIVDFGLAKLVDTTWNPIGADSPTLRALTAHGELLGTPGYMAPEQVTGKLLDPRADIFSFGCILYEAIAGTRAFEAETFVDTLYKILHEEAAPIDGAPAELQRIVDKCLAKDRDDRYATSREVANALRAWSAGVPPAEQAPSGRPVKLLLVAALIATVPILALLLRRDDREAAIKDPAVRRITSDGRASYAAISPDARYVAYITAAPDGRALWLEQIATGRTLAVVPASEAFYAGVTFSRDGEYLYFTRYDSGPIATLYRVSILGGDAQPVVRDIDSRAALSPDGKHIAIIRDDFNRGIATLVVTNADGNGERALMQSRIPDRLWHPAWSPDGTSLVVAQQAKLIEVAYPAGTARTIDTSVTFEAFRGLAWPERDRIVAGATTEESSGRSRLWEIDPDDGEASAITSDLTDLHNPTVSDAGSLAALQVIRQANLFEVDASGRTQQLTSGIGAGNGLTGVAWIGDRVVYAAAADGKHDL